MITAPSWIQPLSRAECEVILARNHVGRLAYRGRRHVDIEPLGYVYHDGVVTMRTSPGAKVETLAHEPYVAFEVDEVEGPFRWRSVVVRGTVYRAEPTGSDRERAAYAKSVRALRAVDPGAFEAGDRAAFRDVILRLHIAEISGRAATQ